jgi:DNA-binding SARP family transcriptional activator
MPTLRVRFLGTLDIRDDDLPLCKPPTLKSQSLLAYLIYHRHQPQPRERLAGLFWGDRPEPKARQSLATALWHIRRCLPPEEYILSDFQGIQFDPRADLCLDVDLFEREIRSDDVTCLKSAVALYRGDFLEGFYDDWIINERYRLEALFFDALARLMIYQEAAGEHQAALSTALRLLQWDPVREDAHRLAMRTYCRLGQRNAVLEQYQRCREIVRAELDAEPMVETTELYQAILAGRFEVGCAPEVHAVRLPQRELPARVGRNPLETITPSRLVGREEELDFLQRCWVRAEGGQGGLVFISGEAGVGKTRLVEEFASRLRWQGVRVLWGRCYEFERLLPYQPIAEALRSILPILNPVDEMGLAPWVVAEVARLLPELAEQYSSLETSTLLPSDREQARLFEGVACFLRGIAAQEALLMVVEDLHWASESTLQMLHYLVRRLIGHVVLLVGTLRPEAAPHRDEAAGRRHSLLAFERQLRREGLARSLRLPRLSQQALEAIVLDMSGVGDAVLPLAGRLYRETEGNPFFFTEMVKALFDTNLIYMDGGTWQGDFGGISAGELPLPASLSEAIQARVDFLNDDAQEVLRLAAVLGREFDFDLLNAVCGRGELATLEALELLLRRRLIDEGSGAMGRDYAFTHHKIQEVVYAGLRGRRLLHRRVAEAVENLLPHDASALAWHYERAEEQGRAARYALQAGLSAKAVFAHAEASAYFDRALALLEGEAARLRDPETRAANRRLRIQVLNERGWGLRLLGDMTAYDRDLGEVARLAESLSDQRTLAHLRWREAYTHRWFCRYAQARNAAEVGVQLSQAAPDRSLEALCQREVGMAARATGDFAGAHAALERALCLFITLDDPVYEIHVLCNLSTLYWCRAEFDQAMDLAQRALTRCEETGLSFERRLPLGDIGVAAAAIGAQDRARECLLESLSIARQIADRTQEIFCLGHLGWLCVKERRAVSALEQLQAALVLAESINSRTEQSWLLSGLAEAYRLSGDPQQAEAHARRALDLARATGRAYDQASAQRILDALGGAACDT